MSPDAPSPPLEAVGFRGEIHSRTRDWKRGENGFHAFGGSPLLDTELPLSPLTGRRLHLSFDLDLSDPRLGTLGIVGLRRLAILTNYHLDASDGGLWVRHLDEGRRLELVEEPGGPLLPGVPDEFPQLPVSLRPLNPAEAAVETIDELPTGAGPLHQVGGHPLWFGEPEPAPRCPESGEPMRFIATVDSMLRFPLGDRDAPLLFGDCGLMHVWWSQPAGVTVGILMTS